MNNTIQITKKININTDVNFPLKNEILEIANKFTNNAYPDITDLRSWDKVKKENQNLYYGIVKNIYQETIYYINKVGNIPKLTDKFEVYSFNFSTFYYTLSNPDIRNRDEHVFILHFVSEDLLLLDVIDNHLIISISENPDKTHNTCMIKIDESISISKYSS